VQLAHHLLSPSVEIRGVIGSAVAHYDPSWSASSADASVGAAHQVAMLAGREQVMIVPGSNDPLERRTAGRPSAASKLLVDEAGYDDDRPLFVVCGGGLTNIATAWLMEPSIAERLTLIWIGGREHPDLAHPVERPLPLGEYNLSIDPIAAQVVFNDSDLDIWQVPVDAYSQILVSRSELLARMRPMGPLGAHLFDAIEQTRMTMASFGVELGETYVLGDSPLVLLTALLSSFQPMPLSSRWVDRPCPWIADDGTYEQREAGHSVRVFVSLDSRLVNEDLFQKLQIATNS
jgi:hypothetical protein